MPADANPTHCVGFSTNRFGFPLSQLMILDSGKIYNSKTFYFIIIIFLGEGNKVIAHSLNTMIQLCLHSFISNCLFLDSLLSIFQKTIEKKWITSLMIKIKESLIITLIQRNKCAIYKFNYFPQLTMHLHAHTQKKQTNWEKKSHLARAAKEWLKDFCPRNNKVDTNTSIFNGLKEGLSAKTAINSTY